MSQRPHSADNLTMSWRQRPLRQAGIVGAMLAALLAVAWAAHGLALQRGLQAVHEAAQQRLEVEAARLDAQLSRFGYLPSLLETSPEVLRLLAEPGDAALRASVSRYLEKLNSIAGAESLYVLHRAGRALAASDDGQPGSPAGQDLSYRPYMRDALAQGRGQFYGMGVTSGRAGYYLSYALPGHGAVLGVATVKVDLEAGERAWRELPGELLLLDEHQVVILSSHAAWKFHPLAALPAEVRAEAAQSRRYGAAGLAPLDWQELGRFGERATRVRVEGTPFLATARAVNQQRWRLVLLDDEAPVRAAARTVAVSAALAAAVGLLALLLWLERQRALRQRLASREALQAANDSLERKVRERTAELQAAQDQLVHAGKLAALGQMSAGMVHELNQPLAALRTLSDNAVQLMDRQRLAEARGNLARIGRLVDRLGRLTNQLKVFARKSDEPVSAVAVRPAIDEALALLAERLHDGGVEVVLDAVPEGLQVAADSLRLEQVLGNLLANAIDATAGAATRRITIAATAHDGWCTIAVRNTGPGIPAEVLPHLFEPFVTSKPAGKGLGLGLMISAHIVQAFGGRLAARNLQPDGAEFSIELPLPASQAPPP